jgi:hypothetical protein
MAVNAEAEENLASNLATEARSRQKIVKAHSRGPFDKRRAGSVPHRLSEPRVGRPIPQIFLD